MGKKSKKKKVATAKVEVSKSLQQRKLLQYYVLVLGCAIIYYVLSDQGWFTNLIKPVFEGYAALSSDILNVLGQETVAIGKEIRSSAFSLMIKVGCDGITPMILYAVAILAFPIRFEYKWKGALVGIIILFILNVIRILTLFFIGKHASAEVFEFIHIDVWSVLYLVMTLFLWLLWMRWAMVSKLALSNVKST